MKPPLENLLNLTEDDIFKPFSVEEVIQKRLKNCTLNPDGTYSSEGNVDLSDLGLTELPVKFKEVKGFFDCNYNQLTSLEGAPEHVGGSFYCEFNKLTSLKGAPREVGGSFWCNSNLLTSLEGAPREVGRHFWCEANPVSVDELEKTISRSYLL